MAFVNEYASDEDIEKYGLKEIWDRYHPLRKGDYFYGRKPEWTINKEKNIFLMVINRGTGEDGNRIDTLLFIDGWEVLAGLKLLDQSSKNLNADPFMLIWDLVRLKMPTGVDISKQQIIDSLKDALRVYGYWGIRNQRQNTIVEFHF